MKRILIALVGIILCSTVLNAQSSKNYYVESSILNLRQQSNSTSDIITKLKKYDNVKSIGEIENGWIKISYKNFEGFVFAKYLKVGKASISYYSVRTGAKCRDGTTSSATGRGACSHHGGVSYWLTSDRKRVNIEN